MGNPFLKSKGILVGKLEGTPGTAETLASSDFDVRIRNPEIVPNWPVDDEAQRFATGGHDEDESIPGAPSVTINFHIKLAWAGDVTTEPKWWKIAKACGLKEKAYTTTGIALQDHRDYDNKTMTWEYYAIQQGPSPTAHRFRFAGSIGNMVLGADGLGNPWLANCSFQAKIVDFDDVATGSILALTSPDTTLAEKLLSNTFTIGGVSQRVTNFQLDLGNQINPVINQGDSTGYDYFGITALCEVNQFNFDTAMKMPYIIEVIPNKYPRYIEHSQRNDFLSCTIDPHSQLHLMDDIHPEWLHIVHLVKKFLKNNALHIYNLARQNHAHVLALDIECRPTINLLQALDYEVSSDPNAN